MSLVITKGYFSAVPPPEEGDGTYPVVPLNFDAPSGSFSGQVVGIICGCAWKGSNLYSGTNGRLYGSRSGIYDEVDWENVVHTNDFGSEDLGPPRTLDIADDLKSPALCLVPGESLYLLTATEVYAMIPGETFATASFPRKVDAARGVLGVRAACTYGDACLYGASDGLWFVRKSTFDSSQPDQLTELTETNRRAWQWFVGTSPTTVVVRQHLGEAWCFNGRRYIHQTRQGRTIKGEWADGRSVVDATSDPARGLVLQLSDGSLALVGRYYSDGGTNLEGSNGALPVWTYSTGVQLMPHAPIRAVAHAEIGPSGEALVDVEGDRDTSPTTVRIDGVGERVISSPIDRVAGAGELLSFTLSGRAADRVLTVEVEVTERNVHRGIDRTN